METIKSANSARLPGPGDDCPELAGLPPLTEPSIIQAATAKDRGAGMTYAHLQRDQVAFVKETEQYFASQVLDEATGHSVWRPDYCGLVAEKKVELVAQAYSFVAAEIGKRIKALDPKSDEISWLKKTRKDLLHATDRCRGEAGLRATLRFARQELALSADDFDATPYLLANQAATVDLKNGKSRPGQPNDRCTKVCATGWLGLEHTNDLLDRVSLEVHGDNQAVDNYFWRWLGRTLMGDALPHEILILFGPGGRNGKSLLLGAIAHILGDYAGFIQSELLVESKFSRDGHAPTPGVLAMKGLRLAIAAELSENQKAAAGKLKLYSGGDPLTGRGVTGKHIIEFNPSHNLVLMTNHLPRIAAAEAALWSRLRVIEYSRRFVPNPNPDLGEYLADETLPEKLRALGPAILAKLVRGCLEAQRDGLNPPAEVMAAVKAYQHSEDLVKQFLEDCCEFGEDFGLPAREAHKAFKVWYAENISDSYPAPGPKKLSAELERFLKKNRISSGIIYIGARLKGGF